MNLVDNNKAKDMERLRILTIQKRLSAMNTKRLLKSKSK